MGTNAEEDRSSSEMRIVTAHHPSYMLTLFEILKYLTAIPEKQRR
jgi:hypothetical protein